MRQRPDRPQAQAQALAVRAAIGAAASRRPRRPLWPRRPSVFVLALAQRGRGGTHHVAHLGCGQPFITTVNAAIPSWQSPVRDGIGNLLGEAPTPRLRLRTHLYRCTAGPLDRCSAHSVSAAGRSGARVWSRGWSGLAQCGGCDKTLVVRSLGNAWNETMRKHRRACLSAACAAITESRCGVEQASNRRGWAGSGRTGVAMVWQLEGGRPMGTQRAWLIQAGAAGRGLEQQDAAVQQFRVQRAEFSSLQCASSAAWAVAVAVAIRGQHEGVEFGQPGSTGGAGNRQRLRPNSTGRVREAERGGPPASRGQCRCDNDNLSNPPEIDAVRRCDCSGAIEIWSSL